MHIYDLCTVERTSGALPRQTRKSVVPQTGHDAQDRGEKIDSTALTWWVSASTKPITVGDTGIEPVTSSV